MNHVIPILQRTYHGHQQRFHEYVRYWPRLCKNSIFQKNKKIFPTRLQIVTPYFIYLKHSVHITLQMFDLRSHFEKIEIVFTQPGPKPDILAVFIF